LFERPEAGERAILVHITLASETEPEDPEEFRELVESAGVTCVGLVTGTRHQPSSRLFLGSGKLESLRELMQAEQADVVLFNHVLSPSQERNLEGSCGAGSWIEPASFWTSLPRGREPMRVSCRLNWHSWSTCPPG